MRGHKQLRGFWKSERPSRYSLRISTKSTTLLSGKSMRLSRFCTLLHLSTRTQRLIGSRAKSKIQARQISTPLRAWWKGTLRYLYGKTKKTGSQGTRRLNKLGQRKISTKARHNYKSRAVELLNQKWLGSERSINHLISRSVSLSESYTIPETYI